MKKFKSLFTIALIVTSIALTAQDKVYYVGHSLVNEHLPHMVMQIASQKGVNAFYRHHINIGACLQLNWTDTLYAEGTLWNPTLMANEVHGTNHLTELTNSYNSIVVTECIDEDFAVNNLDSSAKYAANFINLAKTANPNIRKYVYATWTYANSGWSAWRTQVENNKDEWETLADKVNALTGGGNTYIVPGNYAILALYDSVQAGVVPGITQIDQLFGDLIHLNNNGNYFMACVMAATVHRMDPRGASKILAQIYLGDSAIADPSLRAKLQEIAYNTVCSYARSGVNCSGNVGVEKDIYHDTYTLFPNPTSSNSIFIKANSNEAFEIYNVSGGTLISGVIQQDKQEVDISNWSAGVYFVRCKNTVQKLIVQ